MRTCFSHHSGIILGLFCIAVLLCTGATKDANVIRRNGVELQLPPGFEEDPSPPGGIILAAGLSQQVDQRQLPWESNVAVRKLPASANAGMTPDQRVQQMADDIKTRFGGQIVNDPTIEKVNIPNCTACQAHTVPFPQGRPAGSKRGLGSV